MSARNTTVRGPQARCRDLGKGFGTASVEDAVGEGEGHGGGEPTASRIAVGVGPVGVGLVGDGLLHGDGREAEPAAACATTLSGAGPWRRGKTPPLG